MDLGIKIEGEVTKVGGGSVREVETSVPKASRRVGKAAMFCFVRPDSRSLNFPANMQRDLYPPSLVFKQPWTFPEDHRVLPLI